MGERVTPTEFARSVRMTYPGQYDSVKDDMELTEAILKTHPEMADMVHFGPVVGGKPLYEEERGAAEYEAQHPISTGIEKGAEAIAGGLDTMNVANPMKYLGHGLGWVADKVQDLGEATVGKDATFKPFFEMSTQGYRGLQDVGESEFERGNVASGVLASSLGIVGETIGPRHLADMGIAAARLPKKAPPGPGQASLPLKDPSVLRPGVENFFSKLAPEPFDAIRARAADEAHAMEGNRQTGANKAELTRLASEETRLREAMGADYPYGDNLMTGVELQAYARGAKNRAKGKLAETQGKVKAEVAGKSGTPTEAIETARTLKESVEGDLLKLPEDAGLKRIFKVIEGMENPTVTQKLVLDPKTKILTQVKVETPSAVALDKLMSADSDLGKLASQQWDPITSKYSPKGAMLKKLQGSVRESMDRISKEVFNDNPRMAKRIPAIRRKWKAYYDAFENKTINDIIRTDDVAKIFESLKKNEQGLTRVEKALGPTSPGYLQLRSKFINDLLGRIEEIKTPAERVAKLDEILKDPSGSATFNHFLDDTMKADLRSIVEGKKRTLELTAENIKISDELTERYNRTAHRRRDDKTGDFRDRRSLEKANDLFLLAYNRVKRHGYRYGGTAFIGGSLLIGAHPVYGALVALAGVSPDLFAKAYANSPKFRTRVNAMIDSPSTIAEGALRNSAQLYLLSRKEQGELPNKYDFSALSNKVSQTGKSFKDWAMKKTYGMTSEEMDANLTTKPKVSVRGEGYNSPRAGSQEDRDYSRKQKEDFEAQMAELERQEAEATTKLFELETYIGEQEKDLKMGAELIEKSGNKEIIEESKEILKKANSDYSIGTSSGSMYKTRPMSPEERKAAIKRSSNRGLRLAE